MASQNTLGKLLDTIYNWQKQRIDLPSSISVSREEYDNIIAELSDLGYSWAALDRIYGIKIKIME